MSVLTSENVAKVALVGVFCTVCSFLLSLVGFGPETWPEFFHGVLGCWTGAICMVMLDALLLTLATSNK